MALLVPANVAVGERLDRVVTLPRDAGRCARVGLQVPGPEMGALFLEIEREMLRPRSAERQAER